MVRFNRYFEGKSKALVLSYDDAYTCSHPHMVQLPKEERLMELWKDREELSVFTLCGHSHNFEREGNWEVLEQFCRLMGAERKSGTAL